MKYSPEPPACFSNFVPPCRKKEKAGNNRSPVLNDSRVLSRRQFDFSPTHLPTPVSFSRPLLPTLYSRVCLLRANRRRHHPRFYRKVFAVSVGRTGHPSWRVERERSARNVNTNIMIYRRNIEQRGRDGRVGGGLKGRKVLVRCSSPAKRVAKRRRKRRIRKKKKKKVESRGEYRHTYAIVRSHSNRVSEVVLDPHGG